MWGRTEKGDYLNHTGFLSLDLRSFAAGQLIRERIPAASDNGADLGSLMNLGITREQIDDILCSGNEAYVYAIREIAPFICRELTRVRNVSVEAAEVPPSECALGAKTETGRGSSASERIDCLIALVFHLSRSQAQSLVRQEKIFADGRAVTSSSYCPSAGERISVRGYGKFRYNGAEGRTRKGRLIVTYELYV